MKTCNYPGCDRPRWSNKTGMCQAHTPKKELRSSSKLRKRFIVKSKRKKPIHVSFGFTSQKEMFESIWEKAKDKNGEVYSEISGTQLTTLYDTDLWYSCFAHILDKGKYPKYKLNPDNIMLVTPWEHFLIDQGTNKARIDYENKNYCSFSAFYKKKDKLLKQYKAKSHEN